MPEEPKRPLKVFLSYASQDKPTVHEFSRRLASEGWIDPWVDEKKLLPGQDWRTKIEEAVETSDIVIICLSSSSVGKEGFVQKELRYAREIAFEKPDETIFLIPLRLDDCPVPRGLRFFQWGDYFEEKKEDTYNALLEALKIRHEQRLKFEEDERARLERERLERETIEKVAREKVEREAAERKVREEADRIEREKTEREAAEKAQRERKERQALRMTKLKKAFTRSFASLKLILAQGSPFFRIGSILGIIIVLVWFGWLVVRPLFSPMPTAMLNATITPTVTYPAPKKIFTPTPTKTHLSTWTPSFTPTATLTSTPIPQNSILLQEDFEDNKVDARWFSWNSSWSRRNKPNWTIEQEPNGNHYASASGLIDPSDIWYGDKNLKWTDYAFESRIKFPSGSRLSLYVHANAGRAEYTVQINPTGYINFSQWNADSNKYADLGSLSSKALIQNKWYTIRVEIKGELLSVYVDNSLVGMQQLPTPLITQGSIGYSIGGEKIYLDDIKVWSIYEVPAPTRTPSSTPSPIPPEVLTAISPKPELLSPVSTLTSVPPSNVLLQVDFEDHPAVGWNTQDGNWFIEQESDGNHYWSASGSEGFPQAWYGNITLGWKDYAFESRIKFVDGGVLRICFHADSNFSFSMFVIDNASAVNFSYQGYSDFQELSTWTPNAFVRNKWYTIRVEIRGNLATAYVDNVRVKESELNSPLLNSQGGIGYLMDGGETLNFDDIRVWSLK